MDRPAHLFRVCAFTCELELARFVQGAERPPGNLLFGQSIATGEAARSCSSVAPRPRLTISAVILASTSGAAIGAQPY